MGHRRVRTALEAAAASPRPSLSWTSPLRARHTALSTAWKTECSGPTSTTRRPVATGAAAAPTAPSPSAPQEREGAIKPQPLPFRAGCMGECSKGQKNSSPQNRKEKVDNNICAMSQRGSGGNSSSIATADVCQIPPFPTFTKAFTSTHSRTVFVTFFFCLFQRSRPVRQSHF